MRPFDARLLRLAPRARAPLFVLALLGLVGGLAAIAQAFAVAGLVLAVVRNGDIPAAATFALGAFAVRGLAAAATEVVAARAGSIVSGDLRAALLASLLARPADERPDASQALMYATQGATSVEPYVARYLPTLINAAVLPAAAVVAMFSQDWITGLIPIFTLPLLPLFAALIGANTADATAKRMRTLAGLSGHFLDVMRGLPALVSYGRAQRQARVINQVSHDHRRATVETLKLAFMSSAALELLATLSVAIVAVWTGIALANGTMELHIALPLILLAPEAYWPVRRVGAEFHNAAEGAKSLATIADEIEKGGGTATATAQTPAEAPTVQTDGAASRSVTAGHASRALDDGSDDAVVIDDLTYAYAEGLPVVVDHVNARFGRGLSAITGPSGVGKTTLLELIAGIRRPVSGSVSAPRAHLVTQRPFLAAGTLRDNLTLGTTLASGSGSGSDEVLMAALGDVGLGEFVAGLPSGLDTVIGDDGFGLSAGQRARVALARALLSDPADRPIVLLDEPTAHLDPQAEQVVHEAIQRLARERIVIAVTHRDGLARLADNRVDLGAIR
ncbi:MAG: thiol reductant ABC exporter subunit CydD [Dermatophilus congolensis]|nr:thiol reductant ABC exporter subunit CydD [Dermatophilus congolensis]